MWLEESKFRDANGAKQKLLGVVGAKPLEMRFADAKLNEEAARVPFEPSTKELLLSATQIELVLTQKLTDLTVTKKLVFKENGSYSLEVLLSKDVPYYITPGIRPDVLADTFTFKGTLLVQNDGKVKTVEDGGAKVDEPYAGIGVAATVDRYYASILYSSSTVPSSLLRSCGSSPSSTPTR